MKSDERKYMEFVGSLSCKHCGVIPVQVHHAIGTGSGITGGRNHWSSCAPLCYACHAEVDKDPKSYPQLRWLMETLEEAVKAEVLVVK